MIDNQDEVIPRNKRIGSTVIMHTFDALLGTHIAWVRSEKPVLKHTLIDNTDCMLRSECSPQNRLLDHTEHF